MRAVNLRVHRFRGFDSIELTPRGHVLLVGEPRAGRSDLLAAIRYVLDPAAVRSVSELDFYKVDTDSDVSIEITLADLPAELEQQFLDHLEFWDPEQSRLVDDVDNPDDVPDESIPVVRLGCRISWDDIDDRATAISYWPKSSDPSNEDYRRVSREDRLALPFIVLGTGRPLNLAPRGSLRAFLDSHHPGEITSAIDAMAEGIESLAVDLTGTEGISDELFEVLEPILPYLGVEADKASDLLRFLPEGGSLSSLLRSLAPAFSLDPSVGFLPLERHGSTTNAQVAAAEAVAASGTSAALVIVDDFGDRLDAPSASRVAALLRTRAGQLWLSTRRAEAGVAFESEEIVRLTRNPGVSPPQRFVHYGQTPTSRAERVAARELDRRILPAMTARGLIIGEGPHDLAAYEAVAEMLEREQGQEAPEAFGIKIIDAGGNQGGIDKVPRVSQLARNLGFRVVAIIDYDNNEAEAEARLAAAIQSADAVVRLPKGVAVERALVEGLADDVVVASLEALNSAYSLPLPPGWQNLEGGDLVKAAVKALKSNGGLHAQFIETLPAGPPPLAAAALSAALDCARGIVHDAHVQLEE